MPPHLASSPHRRERPTNPIEGQGIEAHISGQTEHVETGVEVHRALELTGRQIEILMLSGAVEGHVMEGSVQRADRHEASGEDHRRCNAPDRTKIDVGLPYLEVGERQSAVPASTDTAIPGDRGERIA